MKLAGLRRFVRFLLFKVYFIKKRVSEVSFFNDVRIEMDDAFFVREGYVRIFLDSWRLFYE